MIKFLKSELFRIIFGGVLLAIGILLDLLSLPVVSLVVHILALAASGIGVFADAVRGILRRDLLDEKFLMCIASVGAFCIGESTEGVAVMLFFLVGEYFEHKAVRRSRSSIRALMDICPDTATVIKDGVECEVDAEDVEEGDTVVIRSGERVAVDCLVVSGSAELDTSMLTGEAVPVPVGEGSELDSGTVVLGGELVCVALRAADLSRAARTLELVETATENKSREENFITVFSRYYTPAVIALAVLMAAIPPIVGILPFADSLYRALSFLVVSCPCALVISVPMAFFGGIGGSASQGILYKGGNTFSAISRAETVVFDKTGTLTHGELVTDVVEGILQKDELIALAAGAERASNHPIARALRAEAKDLPEAHDVTELAGLGVEATVSGSRISVGNARLMQHRSIEIPQDIPRGSVIVARDGRYVGFITFRDRVKDEAKEAIAELRRLGVKRTVILSGDGAQAVSTVAEELGIDEYRAELMPEDKYSLLEELIASSRGKTVYVGDGINDAPCIARADVGIAMGKRGQDSAIEAADAVIMSDNLSRIPLTVRIARKTIRIAKQNIVFAIGVKLLVLLLVSLGLAGMWLAVFADVGVAVIAILNAMRTLAVSGRK